MKTKHFSKIIIIILFFSLITACEQSQPTSSSDAPTLKLTDSEEILKTMTLKEKIGQLFIIRPESLDSHLSPEQTHSTNDFGVTKWNNRMSQRLKDYPVGGIVMFNKNISSPKQLQTFINDLKNASALPLLMGVDEEGGQVSRISKTPGFNVKTYQNMAEIGKTQNPNKAKEVGLTIGQYLKDYGFNLNFAPVADVNTNPLNPVIGKRAFGNDPKLVADMVNAAIEGFHEKNIITCIKHFPGHGDTKTDTHDGYAVTEKTWQEMLNCELIPFQAGIKSQTDMIMVAHITAINATTDHLPASLSYQMMTEHLRQDMNFNGIIITDSLAMQAITKEYDSKTAAVMAFQAGADILLMPYDYQQAFEGMLEAVQEGKISEDKINESVLKILKLKEKYQ